MSRRALVGKTAVRLRASTAGEYEDPATRAAIRTAPPDDEDGDMYIIVQHKVRDYDSWKPAFDDHESVRAKYGLQGPHRLPRRRRPE